MRLPTEQFTDIRARLDKADEQRESLIKHSRDLQKDAKHAVYLVHQGDLGKARELVDDLATRHQEAMRAYDDVTVTGAYAASLEEYCEAAIFLAFCEENMVPTSEELGAGDQAYLGGLSDATGELGRRAVLTATQGDKQAVIEIRDFVHAVQGEMVQMHLRNGTLRKKYDSIKYNLKKIEEVLYDLRDR